MTDILDVCLLAVLREEKVLLIHRRRPPYRGYWGMPGGKLRPGETVEQAALREAREETGLQVTFQGVCGVATESITHMANGIESHFVMFVVRLACTGGNPRPGPEGELAWFDRSRLGAARIIPTDRELLRHFVFPSRPAMAIRHFQVARTGDTFRLVSEQEQAHEPHHP